MHHCSFEVVLVLSQKQLFIFQASERTRTSSRSVVSRDCCSKIYQSYKSCYRFCWLWFWRHYSSW